MVSQYFTVDQTPVAHLTRHRRLGLGGLSPPFVRVVQTSKTFPAKKFSVKRPVGSFSGRGKKIPYTESTAVGQDDRHPENGNLTRRGRTESW